MFEWRSLFYSNKTMKKLILFLTASSGLLWAGMEENEALLRACRGGESLEQIQECVNKGADVNCTGVYCGACGSQLELSLFDSENPRVSELKEQYPNDTKEVTPLALVFDGYLSGQRDYIQCAEYLVEMGANVQKANESNIGPLTLVLEAAFYHDIKQAKFFLDKGIKPSLSQVTQAIQGGVKYYGKSTEDNTRSEREYTKPLPGEEFLSAILPYYTDREVLEATLIMQLKQKD